MKKIFLVILIQFLPNIIVASGVVHERILQWWIKISEQKPLKCTINPCYLKPFAQFGEKISGTTLSVSTE